LFTELHDNINDLDNAVNQLAEKLSKLSFEAMEKLKRVHWEGTENWDKLLEKRAEISGVLVLSDFTKKYLKDFLNSRKD
jgi:methylglutaconyl-CoA hydratase